MSCGVRLFPSLLQRLTTCFSRYVHLRAKADPADSSKVYLGSDVFITFLNKDNSIPADLTQTGDGQGTVQLPDGLDGTAFLSATNYQGAAPIPDEQNFAIGFLVVN